VFGRLSIDYVHLIMEVCMEEKYDLIVIGGGSAGMTAATIGTRVGARVLLVDREKLGGDCLHYGCVPSKALIASARLAHRMSHAQHYGLKPTEVSLDIKDVMKRIWDIKAEIGSHESPEAFRVMGADVMFGGARFVDSHTIEVGGKKRVQGSRFIICTGSEAVDPPVSGLSETGSINHVSLFHLDRLPGRLVVIGGGPIGCEMGQALSRLGSKVTIVQNSPRILHREDEEISQFLKNSFEEEGITVMTSAVPILVQKRNGSKSVSVKQNGGSKELECDEILVAVGRKPTIDALNLPAAGVETDNRGIKVNSALQTTRKHIYAAGDCSGGPQFTHWAEYEARIASRNTLFKGKSKCSIRLVPSVTFTDPEVASVGLTMEEAREREKGAVHTHRVGFEKVDRAVCEGEPKGLIKVVTGKRDKILGVHIVGMEAGEALTEWVLSMDNGIGISRIGSSIHVYPTIGRINRRLADARFLDHGIPREILRLVGRYRPRPAEQR
jgi:pyruvate/2-oxoglutarate dehydrogenase complex dihydrolipoamide dehydrogenase (E3) component